MTLEQILPLQCELGEAPVWDPVSQTAYLVDIIRCRLIAIAWSTGATKEWPMPSLGGGLALCRDGRLLVATQTGLFFFSPATGEYDFFMHPEPGMPKNRLNEGKVDPEGRFWIGSMCTVGRQPTGALYRIDVNGAAERVLGDLFVPNCLVWTLDRRSVLFADSHRKLIWSFAYDAATGALSNQQIFSELPSYRGTPDGGALDQDGCLWNAEFGGSRVVRFAPDGREIGQIDLPATQITSCAFVGPRLDHLMITSTKRMLSEDQRRTQAHAGDVFIVRPGAMGIAEPLLA